MKIFCIFALANVLHPFYPIIMAIITRKIEIKLCSENLSDEERKAQWDLLYRINNNLYKAANNISSKLYLDEYVSSLVWLKHKEYKDLVKELAKAKKQKNPDEASIAEIECRLKKYEHEMTDQELAICKYADEMSSQTLAYSFATELELDIYGQILDNFNIKFIKILRMIKKKLGWVSVLFVLTRKIYQFHFLGMILLELRL